MPSLVSSKFGFWDKKAYHRHVFHRNKIKWGILQRTSILIIVRNNSFGHVISLEIFSFSKLETIIAREGHGFAYLDDMKNFVENLVFIICIKPKIGRRGRDRTVVGFTTTYAIRAYHH